MDPHAKSQDEDAADEQRLRDEIRKKVEKVCSEWGETEREQLIADMARIAMRFRTPRGIKRIS